MDVVQDRTYPRNPEARGRKVRTIGRALPCDELKFDRHVRCSAVP